MRPADLNTRQVQHRHGSNARRSMAFGALAVAAALAIPACSDRSAPDAAGAASTSETRGDGRDEALADSGPSPGGDDMSEPGSTRDRVADPVGSHTSEDPGASPADTTGTSGAAPDVGAGNGGAESTPDTTQRQGPGAPANTAAMPTGPSTPAVGPSTPAVGPSTPVAGTAPPPMAAPSPGASGGPPLDAEQSGPPPTPVDFEPPAIRSGMLARYTLGVDIIPATASCETSDPLSGVAQPSHVIDGLAVSEEPGTYTFTCSGAFDRAGNATGPVTFTYSIVTAGS